jgi:hypothetical protein
VADTLTRFDTVWDVLTVENRARLVRALVDRVEVDERSGDVSAILIDVEGRGETPTSATSDAPAQEASS